MALDVARAHAARVERDDLVVEAGKAPPVLGDQRRIEAAVPIARNRQLQSPFGRQHRLGAAAVAVVGQSGIGLLRKMHIHLGVQHPLGQRLLQIPDQTTRIEHRLRVSPGKQLIQKLLWKRRLCRSSPYNLLAPSGSVWLNTQKIRQSQVLSRGLS